MFQLMFQLINKTFNPEVENKVFKNYNPIVKYNKTSLKNSVAIVKSNKKIELQSLEINVRLNKN